MHREEKGLSGSDLKWIAIVSMFIDHAAYIFIEKNPYLSEEWNFFAIILREIGRLAFPLFCFTLVQGVIHTRDRKKYFARLLLFAVISEVPFDLAFFDVPWYPAYQNVFFTLAMGLLAIYALDYFSEKQVLPWVIVIVLMAVAEWLHTDYGADGVLLIVLFYVFRMEEKKLVLFAGFYEIFLMGIAEAGAIFAFIPMHFYNGKRGMGMKYFFYLFYPVHLLVFALIHMNCR